MRTPASKRYNASNMNFFVLYLKSRFSNDAPNRCKFVTLLREKAAFLIWRAKKLFFWCITTWKSRFSNYAPKTLIFDAFIRGKAGFLMRRKKGANLLHYFLEKQIFSWRTKKGANLLHYDVEKQAFSWRAKKTYIWCINTWKSRSFHDATKNKVYIWCIITFHSRFSHDATKTLIFDAL